jgi:2,4-dienoyl-CoA reductase-like NADH-dependent reductase (Old Yellow Enzyme family)
MSLSVLRPLDLGCGNLAGNRMCFASMGADLCDAEGCPAPAFRSLYAGLVEGGCGFGFLGNANVDDAYGYNQRGLRLTAPRHAQALAPVLAHARERGVPLGVQLQHYGPQANPTAAAPLLSPSAIAPANTPAAAAQRLVAMSQAQIEDILEQFVRSARLAQAAGATLVQLQAANGYLLSSFLSPATNRREDRWGGSPLKRARLLLEIVERIRAATANTLSLTVQLGIDDGLGPQGQQPELLGEVVAALEACGVAAVSCSVGVRETFRRYLAKPQEALGTMRRGARQLKRFTRMPIGFTGSVFDVATAEDIVDSGDADFVGFARAVLADNALVAKEVAGRGHEVHRCRRDANCFRDKRESAAQRVYCCVNPDYLRPQALQQHYESTTP